MRSRFDNLIRSALVLACLDAAPAWAIAVPSPAKSVVPSHIVLVGLSGGVADTQLAEFVVKVRSLANEPFPFASVAIDFGNAQDVRLASVQPDAGLAVNCISGIVHRIADAQGEARFTIVGSGTGVFSPGNTQCVIRVYGDGTLLASPIVHTYDLDGQQGLGAGDLSIFISEFITGAGSWAADYDGSGALGAGDLSLWLTAFSRGTQTSSAGPVCP